RIGAGEINLNRPRHRLNGHHRIGKAVLGAAHRCLSACTLVLSIVPSRRICVTPRAVLGFHAAIAVDRAGHRYSASGATRVIAETYPAPIRGTEGSLHRFYCCAVANSRQCIHLVASLRPPADPSAIGSRLPTTPGVFATAHLSKCGAAEGSHPSVLTDPRTGRGGFCPVHIGTHNQWRAWPPLATVPSRIGMLVQPDRAVP